MVNFLLMSRLHVPGLLCLGACTGPSAVVDAEALTSPPEDYEDAIGQNMLSYKKGCSLIHLSCIDTATDDLPSSTVGDNWQFFPVSIRQPLDAACTPSLLNTTGRTRNPYFPPSQDALEATDADQARFEEDGDLASYPWSSWTESALSLLRHVCGVPDRVMEGVLEIMKHPKFNSADVPSLRKLKVKYFKQLN